MTAKQLESLLIDEALGELSEEASALLDDWLLHVPESRAAADQIRHAVALTGTAVAARPLDLKSLEPAVTPLTKGRLPLVLRRAAAIALLCLALGVGFQAGKESAPSSHQGRSTAALQTERVPSPWARYRVDENGRLAVVLPSTPDA